MAPKRDHILELEPRRCEPSMPNVTIERKRIATLSIATIRKVREREREKEREKERESQSVLIQRKSEHNLKLFCLTCLLKGFSLSAAVRGGAGPRPRQDPGAGQDQDESDGGDRQITV
jgi:hypothetical protein